MGNKILICIAGASGLVGVTGYLYQPSGKGRPSTGSSAWDYYGYQEIAWRVLDRRGRPLPWLNRKLTPAGREATRAHPRILAAQARAGGDL